jgi:YggT family protein
MGNPFLWLILTVLDIYFWIVIAWVVASWLIAFGVINPHNQIVAQILYALSRLVEPVLRPIRRFLPDLGGIDLSPMVLIIGILFLKQFVLWAWFRLFMAGY